MVFVKVFHSGKQTFNLCGKLMLFHELFDEFVGGRSILYFMQEKRRLPYTQKENLRKTRRLILYFRRHSLLNNNNFNYNFLRTF